MSERLSRRDPQARRYVRPAWSSTHSQLDGRLFGFIASPYSKYLLITPEEEDCVLKPYLLGPGISQLTILERWVMGEEFDEQDIITEPDDERDAEDYIGEPLEDEDGAAS